MRALWLRWLLRDLRRRWLLVTAIALVVALGTGTYAALTSTSTWRRLSNDASFARQHLHDLKAQLSTGASVPAGTLRDVVRALPDADRVVAVAERLRVPTPVDASTAEQDVVVAGEIVGVPPGSDVDTVWVAEGQGLDSANDTSTAVLDLKFARARELAAHGGVRVLGGARLAYTGLGSGPEEFVVAGRGGGFILVESGFATIYTSLASAQQLAGLPGRVNDVVLTVRPGTDVARLQSQLQAALAALQPPVVADVTTRADETAYRILYEDIEGDERFWTIIAMLMLVGATFAAVNLTVRVVEGERREIGIGMALGKGPWALALRPAMLGVEIAVVGVLLGLGVGWLLTFPLRSLFIDILPLPVWHTPLVAGPFLRAAAFGALLPLVAIVWPVWRAVRVEPVEAIRVGHLAGRGRARPARLRGLALPGPSYWHAPVRNLARTPRRTVLTALGIAAAISVVVTIGGLIDSVGTTIDEAEQESLHAAPNRLTVTLDTYRPLDDPVVARVGAVPGVAQVAPGLLVPSTATTRHGSVDLGVEVLDPQGPPWQPTVVEGRATGGLVLTRTAARDLGVEPGDTVELTHPRMQDSGVRRVRSPVPVAGVHPYPLRAVAYLDPASADSLFGLTGTTNLLTVVPSPSADSHTVRQQLVGISGVAGVTATAELTQAFRDATEQITTILAIVALVTAALTLLIAFNAASIAAEERRRENATMMAFGLPLRTVLGMATVETALMGLLGSLVGLGVGVLAAREIILVEMRQTLPEIGLVVELGAGTVLQALALGVLGSALAQLFVVRRLRRMDLPATLRVVE